MRLVKPGAIVRCCAAIGVASLSALTQTPFPLSNPTGSFGSFGTLPGRPEAADLNGDGRDDIVGVAPANTVSVMLTAPGGGYVSPQPAFVAPALGFIYAPQVVADLTNDGFADILASFGSTFPPFTPPATSALYPGLGNGSFGAPIPLPAPAPNALEHACFLAPHVPGVTAPGGPPAIVLFAVQNQPLQAGTIYVLAYANGSYGIVSTVLAPTIPALTTAGSYKLRAAGDCNGDGLLDLVGWGGPFGLPVNTVLFRGIAAHPYFAAPTTIPAPVSLQNGPNVVVADVTNDGLVDVVAVRQQSSSPNAEIAVLPGHPTSPFSTAVVSNIGVPVYQMWTSDFDDDGARDLLLVTSPPMGSSVYGVAISRGNGLGGFGTAMTLPASASTSSNVYALADEDGDGRKDAIACATSGFSAFALYDQTRIGPGVVGQTNAAPRTRTGIATPGNPAYFVGVTGGAAHATALAGVSLGLIPAPDAFGNLLDLSPGALLYPSGAAGVFQTDAAGDVTWWTSLPPPPALVGLTVFLEWAVADSVVSTGFSLTPARKIVVW